jgi:hypothetical protein
MNYSPSMPSLPSRAERTTVVTLSVAAIGLWMIVLPLELLSVVARA